jgi:arylsulfatase A-like enzyme
MIQLKLVRCTLAILVLVKCAIVTSSPSPKIIVQMIIDDLGHADTSLNEDVQKPDILTPNLKKLMQQGVRLTSMHSQPVCSPTRSALMTGRFPFRDGMQHETTIMPGSTAAIPVTTPTVPEMLSKSKIFNFTSAAIGKWHLGYASFNNTPTERGFDHFVGYHQGQVDYYNKTIGIKKFAKGFDFWNNKNEYHDAIGNYSLHQYMYYVEKYISDFKHTIQEEAEHAAQQNNVAIKESKLYIYLSHQTVHIPLEAAGEDDRCKSIHDYWRRVYCSMLVELDDSIGQLTTLLTNAVGDDWVILCMGDNGGMVRWATTGNSTDNAPNWPASAGDNYPLRGSKTTLFQGGVRSTSFITAGSGSNYIPSSMRGTTYDGLMHACDIAATVLGLGGVNVSKHSNIDGLDHWDAITTSSSSSSSDSSSLRNHVPINIINNGSDYTAIRFGDMKLIVGSPTMKYVPAGGWYKGGVYPSIQPEPKHKAGTYYLFNITNDPYEHHELNVNDYQSYVQHGLKLISSYIQSGRYMEPQPNRIHIEALPRFHGGTWAPWLK